MDMNNSEWRNPNSADGIWEENEAPYGTPPDLIRSHADGGAGSSSGRPGSMPVQSAPPSHPLRPLAPEDLALDECVRELRAYGMHTDRLLYKREVKDQIAFCVLAYRASRVEWSKRPNLGEELTFLGGAELRDNVQGGATPIEPVARSARSYYNEVKAARKAGGFAAALAAVKAMPETHAEGFSPKRVGWIALRDVLGDQPRRDLVNQHGMPREIPRSPISLFRFANERPRFARVHSPIGLIGVAVLLSHSDERERLGRKRKIRSHKGESRRGWNVSFFPSTAFLDATAERTGASRNTVRVVLQQARFELPPELYLV